jgi:glutathione synthase/RimK-type ligase-like ATP-grasp enzyme
VIGEVFATRIDSDEVDYRYAHRDGGHIAMTPWKLSDELAQQCVALCAQVGLNVAGIDLMMADDGEVFCFEVNPSPAFSFFESYTGQPISRSIALALARGVPLRA